MSNRERNDAGQFTERVTLDAVLGVFDQVRGPVVTSSDVADALDCTTEAARQKLTRLYDQGRVDRRKTGRTTVWWRTGDEPDRAEAPTDVQAAGRARERGVTPAEDTTDRRSDPAPTPETTAVKTGVGGLEFDRDLTPARREHLVEWLEYAAGVSDGVRKSDFSDWWTDDRAAETGYNAGSFWEAFAKAAMKQADGFQKPDARTYRYVDADADQDQDTDALDESGPYDPTDEWE